MEALYQNIIKYINTLDWAYVITFILLSYAINHYKVTEWIANGIGITIRTRYRVLIVGVIYGIIVFFARDYTLQRVEHLLQSFVFAIVFHKFIIEILVERVFPKKDKRTTTNEYL
ncbi:hypothetical protein [Aquimarina longa]|uniref:hypothetical protein n=1 Tax=Aquimarina longa TaxID=1080221 RepID=UPI000782C2DD|nr:hypothetical protein [Aquimarina longa]